MGIEIFERAVEGAAVLLKAEAGGQPGVLLLTFEAGRIQLSVSPGNGELEIAHLESADAVPAGLEDGSEEEPWWRLIGAPLARVWRVDDVLEGGLCLQFREDDQNPRIVTLAPRGGSVSVRLENPPPSA